MCSVVFVTIYPTTPGSSHEVVLYGELNKWVSMSPQRVHDIARGLNDIEVVLKGAFREWIKFSYRLDGVMQHVDCYTGLDGRVKLQIVSGRCRSV